MLEWEWRGEWLQEGGKSKTWLEDLMADACFAEWWWTRDAKSWCRWHVFQVFPLKKRKNVTKMIFLWVFSFPHCHPWLKESTLPSILGIHEAPPLRLNGSQEKCAKQSMSMNCTRLAPAASGCCLDASSSFKREWGTVPLLISISVTMPKTAALPCHLLAFGCISHLDGTFCQHHWSQQCQVVSHLPSRTPSNGRS